MRRSGIDSTPLEFSDLKGVAGFDIPSTVITEISGGPRPVSQGLTLDNGGASPKARKLLGWFRRASIEEPKRRSCVEEEDHIGIIAAADSRTGQSVETTQTAGTGITVSYDIRRTVEEIRPGSSLHNANGVGIESLPSRKDDIV
jgi:hypothetical protein